MMKSINNYRTDFPDQGGPPKAFSFGKVQVCTCISFPVESSEQVHYFIILLPAVICYNILKVELFNLSTILEVFESRNHVMLFDRAR